MISCPALIAVVATSANRARPQCEHVLQAQRAFDVFLWVVRGGGQWTTLPEHQGAGDEGDDRMAMTSRALALAFASVTTSC